MLGISCNIYFESFTYFVLICLFHSATLFIDFPVLSTLLYQSNYAIMLVQMASISNQESRCTASPFQQISSFQQTDSTVRIPKSLLKMKEFLQSDHEAVQLITKSMQAHRSSYQAMVFLYGVTGHGKSSTLNHLFNTELISTSDDRSCTRDVTEYVATMDSTHWNVTDLEIGFVDTPGFGDTVSQSKNIENLAKIDSFLSNHPFLNSELVTHRIYPNIVMIVSSFTDNRMAEFNSQFSKMLRMLSKFNIVDNVRRNVVIVLTNALSIHPLSKYDEKKKRKLELLDNLSRLHFGVSIPIILIENVYEDLETRGDWKLLPDGTKQPLNLFDAMISLMKQSGDEIGIETVRLLFQNRRNIQIHDERRLGVGIFKDKKCQPDVKKWEEIFSSEFHFQFETTELNRRIIACVEGKYFPQLSSLSYQMVSPLMHRMQEVNLTNVSEISTKNIEEINQLLYPFCMNKQERILLFELFKVKPLEFLKFHMLGSGVLPSDSVLKFHIVSLKELKYCYEIGTHIPENSIFTSKGKLLIHCHIEWGKGSIFSPRKAVVTFSVQYEVFDLTIDFKKLTFDQMESSFARAVSSLPNNVPDLTDKRTSNAYKSFIDKYGTQCVLGVSYGGEINGSIDLTVEGAVDRDYLLQLSFKLKNSLWIYFESLENGQEPESEYSKFVGSNLLGIFEKILHSPITWGGGDKQYHTSNLKDISRGSWKRWINSLCNDFRLLENIVHVCPIAALISKQNEARAFSFQRALEVSFPREFTPVDSYVSIFKNPNKVTLEQSQKDIPLVIRDTRIAAGESVKSIKSPCSIL